MLFRSTITVTTSSVTTITRSCQRHNAQYSTRYHETEEIEACYTGKRERNIEYTYKISKDVNPFNVELEMVLILLLFRYLPKYNKNIISRLSSIVGNFNQAIKQSSHFFLPSSIFLLVNLSIKSSTSLNTAIYSYIHPPVTPLT